MKIKLVSTISGEEDLLQRAITTCSPRPLHWRAMRTNMVAHSAAVVRNEGGDGGILKGKGFGYFVVSPFSGAQNFAVYACVLFSS